MKESFENEYIIYLICLFSGNGQTTDAGLYLTFSNYLKSCAENQFSYPLLHDQNPINLCNVSQITATYIWVGVYRQILDVDHFGKTGD